MKFLKPYNIFNESVKDLMKGKSNHEIDEELEDLEPIERLQTIFEYYINCLRTGIEPIYTQEQMDNMSKDYIEIIDHSHDLYDKVESLYNYCEISSIIRQELKYTLSLLSPSYQLDMINNIENIKKLYTKEELKKLRKSIG